MTKPKIKGLRRFTQICIALLISYGAGYAEARQPTASPSLPEEQLEFLIMVGSSDSLQALEHTLAKNLQLDPSSSFANYLMSIMMLRLYLSEPSDTFLLRQASELAAQAYELSPKSEYGFVALAQILDVTGESEKARKLMQESRKILSSTTWRSAFVMARIHASLGDYTDALNEFERALMDPRAPRKVVAQFILSALSEQNSPTDSEQRIISLAKNFPTSEFDIALANLYLRQNKPDIAETKFKKILAQDSGRIEGLVGLAGLNMIHRQNYREARRLYRLALDGDVPASIKPAIIVRYLEASLKLNPADFDIGQAVIAVKASGDPDSLILQITNMIYGSKTDNRVMGEFFRAIHRDAPGIALSYALYGDYLSKKLGKRADAIRQYTNAIVLDNQRSHFFVARGLAFYDLKKIGDAQKDFERATEVDPTDAIARYNLACTLALSGRNDEAVDILASAIALDRSLADQAMKDQDFKRINKSENFLRAISGDEEEQDVVAH